MATAIILARIAQYMAGAALFGAPLFLLYAAPRDGSAWGALPWPRPLAIAAGLTVTTAAVAYLLAQTAAMAGDRAAATDPEMLASVLGDSALGFAVAARTVAAVTAVAAAAVLTPGRPLWLVLSLLGALVLASFAWTGHGAAGEGTAGLIQLIADLLHLLAAGVWIGALFAFALLLARPSRSQPSATAALHAALVGFAGVGSAVVAVIVASGLVNSWFLIGPTRWPALFSTTYGVLLLIKLLAVGGMAALAAMNRFVHTPALGRRLAEGDSHAVLKSLRRSVFLETALGVFVLVLVGVLGMLAPISSL